jgi:hypothetical protein
MFLPERVSFKLPGLPGFAKTEIAIFWLLVGVLLFHRQRLRQLPFNKWITLCLLSIVGGRVVTIFLNMDPIVQANRFLPAHTPYDVVHNLINVGLSCVVPFVLGAAMFRDQNDLRVLFRVLAGAAIVYGFLMVIELRLSPQLHNWVYGFFQHSFKQMKREGGFRPIVFMRHALTVAVFTMMGVTAVAALYKRKERLFGLSTIWPLGFLWLVLLMSKSLAATLYSLVAVPLVLFFKPGTQYRFAALLGVAVLLYPAVRSAGLVPVDRVHEVVMSQFGESRAGSLRFRLENEDLMLERARERSLFGWGGSGRSRVYHERSGRKAAIVDGDWLITMSHFGWVGFLSRYFLLLLPIFMTAGRMTDVRKQSDRRLYSALALMIAFSAVDLLPNGNWNYLPFVFSGVLLGCTPRGRGSVRSVRHRRSSRHWARRLLAAGDERVRKASAGERDTQHRRATGQYGR